MIFNDINKPDPLEIKSWLKELNFSVNEASIALGISKRQFSRFLSGETSAKKIHGLAMQMLWLISENNKDIQERNIKPPNRKSIAIPIK